MISISSSLAFNNGIRFIIYNNLDTSVTGANDSKLNQFTPEIALYHKINQLAVRSDKRAKTLRTSSNVFLFYTAKIISRFIYAGDILCSVGK